MVISSINCRYRTYKYNYVTRGPLLVSPLRGLAMEGVGGGGRQRSGAKAQAVSPSPRSSSHHASKTGPT